MMHGIFYGLSLGNIGLLLLWSCVPTLCGCDMVMCDGCFVRACLLVYERKKRGILEDAHRMAGPPIHFLFVLLYSRKFV